MGAELIIPELNLNTAQSFLLFLKSWTYVCIVSEQNMT